MKENILENIYQIHSKINTPLQYTSLPFNQYLIFIFMIQLYFLMLELYLHLEIFVNLLVLENFFENSYSILLEFGLLNL